MRRRTKPLWPPRPMLREPRPLRIIAEYGARLRPPPNFRSPRVKLKSSPARTARLSQPAAALRPGICSMTGRGPGLHGRTSCPDEPATRSDCGLAYAAVVARRAGLQQPSGTHKPQAKGSSLPETAAASEAAPRRMSQGDMSGPLCGMPSSTHVVNTCALAGQRPNRTPIFISGVNDNRVLLTWLWAS
jgi:hypothetical protein